MMTNDIIREHVGIMLFMSFYQIFCELLRELLRPERIQQCGPGESGEYSNPSQKNT